MATANPTPEFQRILQTVSASGRDDKTYLVEQRNDVFACLPTGYGKTEIYTLVPLVMERMRGKQCIMLVVSPLLSLMQDQVERLQRRGISAAYIGETQKDPEIKRGVVEGKYSLVFASPEALLNSKTWRGMLTSSTYREKLVAMTVDEAHCVTTWGKEFRKDYKRLAELRSLVADVPVLALTATATEDIRKDILSSLCMEPDTYTVSKPSNRPNIMYHAIAATYDMKKEFHWLLSELKDKGQSCSKVIIYCRNIKACSQMYKVFMNSLGDDGYNLEQDQTKSYKNRYVAMFHRSTANTNKNFVLEQFTKTDSIVRITIATIAFGMGINVPDVYAVVHWGAPRNVEGFYQESGRAGRDGQPAHSLILHHSRTLAKGSCSPSMASYCKLGNDSCRRKYLLDYFALKSTIREELSVEHTCCDSCGDSSTLPWHTNLASSEVSDEELLRIAAIRQPTSDQLNLLRESLKDFRRDYMEEMGPTMYSFNVVTGFSLATIDCIVECCATLLTKDDIMTDIGLWDEEVVDMVFNILDETFQDNV
ncbi:ATP-dependent DNA helicase Q-like SIM [Branchiostoma floridae]|uniref:DNA 3'-5' helicase n=1 Tax=Branchiostoma floridae TaxID=7739 RepID=A0A9J7M0Y2_BRAFL|nr:ATP-dependent DNA helicase Q-like SIM [Branchiostoma floridae]